MIEESLPGIYVYSIEIGDTVEQDEMNGFIMNANDQIDYVCNKLSSDPKLASGFNAIGFSQGGQFFRGYVERCNYPPVHNLVSIGGQHQGVFGFPKCNATDMTLCEYMRELLDLGAYVPFVQDHLAQADYWHDPLNEKLYLDGNIFLPDINNAHSAKNATYKNNMLSLNKFSMTLFTHDTMVQPIESEWFGFYVEGQDQVTEPLQATPLYTEDWLGLQEMDKGNRLDFLSVEGDHLQFSNEWFTNNIIFNYLNNTII
jgi:palmitoyl-protein thioesterase